MVIITPVIGKILVPVAKVAISAAVPTLIKFLRRASSEGRKAKLREIVADRIQNGFRIESQSDFQAVLVKGHLW